MTLAKPIRIVVILQIITFTTGFINIYKDDTHSKSKRSPIADGFPLFGLTSRFSVPKTISYAQQSLGTIGQIFTSPLYQHQSEEELHKVVQISSVYNNNRPETYNTASYASVIQNQYVTETTEKTSLDDLVKSNSVRGYIQTDNKLISGRSKHENNNKVHTDVENKTINKQDNRNNQSEEFTELDIDLINSIFSTSTEDTTLDYTTETGDYDNSTTDELLRIPAAAVATLLGK